MGGGAGGGGRFGGGAGGQQAGGQGGDPEQQRSFLQSRIDQLQERLKQIDNPDVEDATVVEDKPAGNSKA